MDNVEFINDDDQSAILRLLTSRFFVYLWSEIFLKINNY